MSDSKSGADWAKDWQAMQQQYWNAWSDLTRNQAGMAPGPATPWHEGLDQWARMVGGAGKQSEAAERLMASAKNYLGLMQSVLAFAAGKGSAEAAAPSWFDALRNGMNMPGVDPTMFANMPGFGAALVDNPMAKALRDISGPGLKNFQQLASGAVPMLQQFQNEGMSWLHAPAFGYLREHQEHYQKMALGFVEFQKAAQQYNALMLKASQRSFEILESKIAERAEPGRQIDSMRALYDLWVDAAEEAYAEIALSDEFRTVYGDVVNAQMRVRSQLQQEVERIGVDLGMPTRTELNSVHKRLHELRRELRATQQGGRMAVADGRDAEIAAMRAEIDEMRRLLVNSGAATPAARAEKPGHAPKPATPAAPHPAPKRKTKRATAKRGPAKRAAAKRAHVATKVTVIARPSAPAAKRPSRAAKPNAAARATSAVRSARPAALGETDAPQRGRVAQAGTSASFGEAIAAMRRELQAARSKPAVVSVPVRISKPIALHSRRAATSVARRTRRSRR